MVGLKELKKGNYIVWKGEPCLIRDMQFSIGKDATLELQGLFSRNMISAAIPLTKDLQEADITRKCATIISKKKGKLEIMDAITFETIAADIDESMLEEADENDQVTYIQFGDTSQVLEVRKR